MADRLSARAFLALLTDDFTELPHPTGEYAPDGPLAWDGYGAARARAAARTGETESVVCGTGRVEGTRAVLIAFEFGFLGGSLGARTGDRLEAAYAYARERRLPVVPLIATGGSRMQEGMVALTQLQRVARQSELTRRAGLAQIAVLRDPTTGGGWATLGAGADVILALPGAQVGFAGSRVRPPDTDPTAYTAEAQLAAGAADAVIPAGELRGVMGRWLRLLGPGREVGEAGYDAGDAGDAGYDAPRAGWDAGRETGETGQDAGQAGRDGQDAGDAGRETGEAGRDAASTGRHAGQTGQETGDAGHETGQTRRDAASTGRHAGQAGQDAGQAMQETEGTRKRTPAPPPAPLGATALPVTGWDAVVAARDPRRPRARQYLDAYFSERAEISGDRCGGTDPEGMLCGFGTHEGRTVAYAAQTGAATRPAGYRTAARLIRLAGWLGIPVLTLVDTPGAANDAAAERQGAGAAIAEVFGAVAAARTPVTTLVIGEGGSGGALALAAPGNTYATPDSYFSVIAPELAAQILKREPAQVRATADQLRIRPQDLAELGIVREGAVDRTGDQLFPGTGDRRP
ncbi:carboxyl transferase domain-containing protein [Streptomyces sp. NPDC004610]|uniref:carboxyl transferase domain-containing protein n=1 Tax=unclassified Streptomyces TaxID=2593676 RepID=UPI0033B13792